MAAQAFIFDLNGTMIDDMPFHAKAWYDILNNDLGAELSWEQVKAQMYGKNQELLVRIFGHKFSETEMERISWEKEKRYQAAYRPHLKLIDGLDVFLREAYQSGIKLAIGSAAITYNINFVLDGLNIRHYFSSIVSADDVAVSKPHPETFLKAAEELGVLPQNCLVFEDAPKGVEAALRAGMKAIVLTTMHGEKEFSQFDNVVAFIKDYNDPYIYELLEGKATLRQKAEIKTGR